MNGADMMIFQTKNVRPKYSDIPMKEYARMIMVVASEKSMTTFEGIWKKSILFCEYFVEFTQSISILYYSNGITF
jgi:hypothetical protein